MNQRILAYKSFPFPFANTLGLTLFARVWSGKTHVHSAQMGVAAIVSHMPVSFLRLVLPCRRWSQLPTEWPCPTDRVGPKPKVILLIRTLLPQPSLAKEAPQWGEPSADTPTWKLCVMAGSGIHLLQTKITAPYSSQAAQCPFSSSGSRADGWPYSGHRVLGSLSCRHPHSEAGISRPPWHLSLWSWRESNFICRDTYGR